MILGARAILDTEKIQRLTKRIRDAFACDIHIWSHMEMMCGASLAQYGLLGSVKRLCLNNVDLSPVPAQHLASLVSCVTGDLVIDNVSGCDLVSLLTSLKCNWLLLCRQRLGREETQALVQAMGSRMKKVELCNVDLSPMASLASCVTSELIINNLSGCDLVRLLTRLKCDMLEISSQSLGREETQALVQAMESRVDRMWLGAEVTLDIEALVEYSGQGECREVRLWVDTAARYREEVIKWAKSKNWTVCMARTRARRGL